MMKAIITLVLVATCAYAGKGGKQAGASRSSRDDSHSRSPRDVSHSHSPRASQGNVAENALFNLIIDTLDALESTASKIGITRNLDSRYYSCKHFDEWAENIPTTCTADKGMLMIKPKPTSEIMDKKFPLYDLDPSMYNNKETLEGKMAHTVNVTHRDREKKFEPFYGYHISLTPADDKHSVNHVTLRFEENKPVRNEEVMNALNALQKENPNGQKEPKAFYKNLETGHYCLESTKCGPSDKNPIPLTFENLFHK